MNKIGLAVRVKNEMGLLDKFIKKNKIRDLFKEIVFLDDMSTDGTFEKLYDYEKEGWLKVYRRDMQFDFATQRNYLDALMQSPYILHIDIDQYISKELEQYILQFNGDKDAYKILRYEIVNDKLLDKTYCIILYKNNRSFKWVRRVHSLFQGYTTFETVDERYYLLHEKDSNRCKKQNAFYWDNFEEHREIVRQLEQQKNAG